MRTRRIRRDFQFAGVYIIRNLTSGKIYIGSSTNLIYRLRQHENQLIAGKHPCKEMQADFDRNHHFSFDILDAMPIRRKCSRGLLSHEQRNRIYAKERLYMDKFSALGSGYNQMPVGENVVFSADEEKDPDA